MSAWRREATRLLHEHSGEIREAANAYDLWIRIRG